MRAKGLMHELSPNLLTQGIYTDEIRKHKGMHKHKWNFERRKIEKINISPLYLHMCHERVSRLYLLTYSVKMQA